MGFLDFLTEGKAVSVPYASSSQTVLPDWYTNYAMQVLSNQNATMNTPYPTFQGPRVAGFNADDNAAFAQTRQAATSYQTPLAAAGAALGAVDPAGALAEARPYFTAAGGRFPDNVDEYMSPYTANVVDRIGELGNRNLFENILPRINDEFIGAGGFGGTRQAEISGRAIRDAVEGIAQQQQLALDQGYRTSADIFNADASRAGTIGSALGNLGQNAGALALNKAGALGTLAGQTQQQGLTGAGALSAIGGAQQQMDQKNYDVAYADFLRQQGYPQEKIDAAVKTLGGVQPAVPKVVQEAGNKPTGEFSPSLLADIGSIASLIKGL